MNQTRIDKLLATVPEGLDDAQRRRLRAHEETVRCCDLRIQRLRDELTAALRGREDDVAPHEPAEPNEVLRIALELDALERVQPRVDGWLKQHVAALIDEQRPQVERESPFYDDGAPV